MATAYEKLIDKLREIFQLDQADLDFGIYRIMNQKRDEIDRFLEQDLLPQVREAFGQYADLDRRGIQVQLNQAIEQANKLGADPETLPRVKELREKLATEAVDTAKLEEQVYADLYNFFRRYYDEGDFISLRRYKEGVYAIPYEGEEVKLYWANHDQYYVKTTEHFRDYTFKLPSGRRVHFKLVDASTETDNNQPAGGNNRRFHLADDDPVAEADGELIIRFAYRLSESKVKQADLNSEAVKQVLSINGFAEWRAELSQRMPTEKNPDRTLLEKQLTQYTARNTFDYFIHKDLGGFLRRELDFYIKNEIMHLDDVQNEDAPKVEQYLARIKVIRRIAHKVIDFLAQIEDFQKKLWLKKKFVVETNYCITLDRVPEELYAEIAANDEQRQDWVRLLAIDDIKDDAAGGIGYSDPLSVDFLKSNPFLILDTQFFNASFKDRILASIDSLEAATNGVLVHGNNFHALNLLRHRFAGSVRCAYADPPFNTSEATFIYKNEYRHSSWCAMIRDTTALARPMLTSTGVLAIAIDDLELHHLGLVCDSLFGIGGRLGVLVVEIKPSGRTNDNYLATSHEYYLLYGPDPAGADIAFFELTEEQRLEYADQDEVGAYKWRDFLRTGGYSTPEERPNSYYPIYYDDQSDTMSLDKHEGWHEIWPMDSAGRKRVWRKIPSSFLAHLEAGEIRVLRARSGELKVQIVDRIKSGTRPKSVWVDTRYDASSHGTKLLKNIFGDAGIFSFPKSVHATQDVLHITTGNEEDAIVLDHFAGSGTTGHAVINLNREDGGSRGYILVEVGDYFTTVLLPRIKKAVYSGDWRDGKPVSRDGISHFLKCIHLESYEDTLNNLELRRTAEQQALLDQNEQIREDYMLRYMLGVESKGSASLLNVDAFEDPFSNRLLVSTGDAGETKPVNVDLVETFNWLLGLRVKHIDTIRGFKVVTGTDPSGESVLIIWRNMKEKSSDDLDEFFLKQGYNTQDMEFGLVYVNGDNNLENLRRPDHTWKVRLIEEEFQRLMFDVEDM